MDFMNLSQYAPWELVQLVSFYFFAAVMVITALGVVTLRNVFHSALCLAVVASGAAVIYLILDAEFLAFAQILIYVGAVITLIAFVIMLTQRAVGARIRQSNDQKFLSLVVSVILLSLLLWKIPTTVWNATSDQTSLADAKTIGNALLTKYLLPFEVISIVLLIALIGAIVLARREKE
jgi:NADH:ubiquinone oxidoreductase subunit 6 (subunit J)